MNEPGIGAAGGTVESAGTASALPRRRDLRGAPPAPRIRRPPEIGGPRPSARPTPPARRGKRPFWNTLVTVVVVPGLFATAALPAYASTYALPMEQSADSASQPGRSFVVSSAAAGQVIDRTGVSATSEEELRARRANPGRAARAAAYAASGALAAGDDYPWFYESTDDQGGGLSPLGYYYRECVDFVAWRLNGDAGTTASPYRWTWSTLTPSGGDGANWGYAWKRQGWATGTEPEAGAVAWFPGANHVAYVKDVLEDGRVLLEEYNWGGKHSYGQRIVRASDVTLFLYAPLG